MDLRHLVVADLDTLVAPADCMVSVAVNLMGSTVVYMVAAFDFVEHPVGPVAVHSCRLCLHWGE